MASPLNSSASEQDLLDINEIHFEVGFDDVYYDGIHDASGAYETENDVISTTKFSCWGRCAAEAKLNCSWFKTALQEEGQELKEDLEKLPPCPSPRELCTVDRIAKRLPIIKWLPKYRLVILKH